jgi:PDDEXK-like domain of unknown function (DUF3799)
LGDFLMSADLLPDGVYFDLPDDVYFAQKRLGSSDFKKLLVSPATYWESSWMNPAPRKDTMGETARAIGRAYHCAMLEPELFIDKYTLDLCKETEKARCERLGIRFIETAAEISEALAELGKPKTKAGESVVERAYRLDLECLRAGYRYFIWHKEKYELEKDAQDDGSELLSRELYKQIETDANRLHELEEVSWLLDGGHAEVSILYTCAMGLRCRARIDYLRQDGWVDLKTFANPRGLPLQKCILNAFQFNGYYMQAHEYRHALECAAQADLPVFRGEGQAPSQPQAVLMESIYSSMKADDGRMKCHYLFHEKGGIPNIVAMEYAPYYVSAAMRMNHAGASDDAVSKVEQALRVRTGIDRKAQSDIYLAKRAYMASMEVYGEGQPWYPLDVTGVFRDEDFSPFWYEDIVPDAAGAVEKLDDDVTF